MTGERKDPEAKPGNGAGPRHSIRVVARRTGLTDEVIRAWERRYGAVRPERTATRRRLYSEAQIERLCLLRALTRAGHRIGDVATLAPGELRTLASAERATSPIGPSGEQRPAPATGAASAVHAACLAAVRDLDAAALDAALAEGSVRLSIPVLLEEVIAPLLRRVGREWQRGELRVAHEHLAAAHVRTFLGTMMDPNHVHEARPVLVAATPPGLAHELGAMMAAVRAGGHGWRAFYLGPDTPAEDIAYTALRHDAAVVALGLCYPPDDALVHRELRRVRARLPAGVALIAGGVAATTYRDTLAAIDARLVEHVAELPGVLDAVRSPASPSG